MDILKNVEMIRCLQRVPILNNAGMIKLEKGPPHPHEIKVHDKSESFSGGVGLPTTDAIL